MKLLAAVPFVCLVSCGMFTHTEINVEFPVPPPFWPDELASCPYLLRYLEGPGSVGEVMVEPGATEVRLRFRKLPVVPVAAVPLCGKPPAAIGACGALYPAYPDYGGAVDPHPDCGGTITLSWEEGFLAELLLRRAASGDPVQAVNVTKLQSEIMKRTGGNPWLLDAATLETAIVSETLAFRSLRLLPVHDIVLNASPGRWIPGNPLSLLPVECNGTLELPALTEGIHSFFLLGGNERIDLSVSKEGWTAVNPVTGAGAAGNW